MTETPNTFWSLFSGYSVIWLLIVFFVLNVMAGQKRLENKLEELESRLNRNPNQ